MAERTAELAALSERIQNLRDLLASAKEGLEKLTDQQAADATEIVRLQERVRTIERELKDTHGELQTVSNKADAAFKKIDSMLITLDGIQGTVKGIESRLAEQEMAKWKILTALAGTGGIGGAIGAIIEKLSS